MRLLLSNILLFSNFMDFSLSLVISNLCVDEKILLYRSVCTPKSDSILYYFLFSAVAIYLWRWTNFYFLYEILLEIDRNKDGWEMKSKNWKLFHFTFSSHLYDVFKFFWLKKLFDHSCLLHLCIIIATSRNQRRKFTPI